MHDLPAIDLSLPPQPTSFIGRQAELADVARRLADPACRLLTLIGPGGIGKTRLAIEAARQQQGRFADGIAFVPLQDVSCPEDIPPAIAAPSGLALAGQADPWEQIIQALQGRQMLVVLDNLEHVLEIAPHLSAVLAAAPGVMLLATSREALNVQEEWRVPLDGLPVPAPDAAPEPDVEEADALRLFAERARRVRPGFSLAQEREAVARICRLVDGLPLAIELAAAWTATLPCEAIAREIERDLSLLVTTLRNVPDRHRSVRAVFDHSWRGLSDEEQEAFRRLAIFRGGFRREAAQAVAGATLQHLAALVAKSLLRYEAGGRYHLHELVRQYALEQWRAEPDARAAAEASHRSYFLHVLAEQNRLVIAGRQREALSEIAAELDNIRLAWSQPLSPEDAPLLRQAIPALAGFYHLRGRYREGFDLLEGMVHRLRQVPAAMDLEVALASALHDLGQLATRLGRFAEARIALEEARQRYARLAEPLPPGPATDPEIGLGVLALVDGDYARAASLGETVRARAEAEENTGNLPYAWYLLAQAALADGRHDSARQAAASAAAAARRSGDDWFLAYCLNDLGTVAAVLGETDAAREHYQASLDLREAFDDLEGMAVALGHLGWTALRDGDTTEAQALFARGREMYLRIGDRGGLAATLHGLGVAAADQGDRQAAAHEFTQALEIVEAIGFAPRALAIALDAAGLLRATQPALAAEVLALAARHPAADRGTRERAEQMLEWAGAALAPATGPPAEHDQPGDLESLLARLQAGLSAVSDEPVPPPSASPPPAPPGQTLADPLTERELTVLRLIAAGQSNQQIADELFLAVSTVKWYASQIFGKLAVRNRTEAVARARELRLLP